MAVIRARAEELQAVRHSPNTLLAYRSDWKQFEVWCRAHTKEPLPATPETVILYLSHLVPIRSIATVERRLAAIAWQHRTAGFACPDTPAVRSVLSGARRQNARPLRQKAALTVPELVQIVDKLSERSSADPRAVRDRAIILLGFACAFRRSELALLNLSDIDLREDRITVTVRRSKTDQHGRGRTLVIPLANDPRLCPVKALAAWITERGRWQGPLFVDMERSGVITKERIEAERVYRVLRSACLRAGLDDTRFGAHSLRAGAATAAADTGADVFEIMALTGHKSIENVAKYVRRAKPNYALRKAL